MSSEHGSGAPSFGDLFEEPETPLHPPAAPSAPVEQVPAAPAPAAPPPAYADAPAEQVPPVEPAYAEPAPAVDPEPAYAEPAYAEAAEPVVAEAAGPTPVAAAGAVAAAVEPVAPEPVTPETPSVAAAGAVGAATAAATAAAAESDAVAGWDHAAPVAPGPVNTGRLYRSTGAEGPQTLDAIPALDPEWLASREQPPLDPAAGAAATATAAAAAATASATLTPEPRVQGGAGLTWTGVFVVTTAATVLIGVADALITGRLGWLTGLALAVSGIYSAFVVRRVDIWAAVIAPPLAFLAAVLTAGQLTLDSAGSLLLREGYMVFRSLATNAPWILGTTLACLVIVLVRRRRT